MGSLGPTSAAVSHCCDLVASLTRMADPPPQPPGDTGTAMDPSSTMTHQAPQLSPLSGAYCLIVVGEPFSDEHKKLILQKLQQGLNTWNINDNHVDLESELAVITDCAPPGEEARGGERLIQFATENLVTEVLIRPYENSISIDVHCCEEGEWKQDKIEHQSFAKLCKVKINPVAVVGESKPVTNFISYVEPFLQPQSIQERLPPSD